ncbi:MAG TPA: DUF58 domain-containing protein [Planctomycetota bacterium]|jgi:uncharacterized protein (DUF58 family)|nr:DUF58 domain-containing protein [Planctomycetota bacterium]
MAEDTSKFLDPRVLDKVGGLELKARLVVEGFMSGGHASPYKGSSVEFAEHREYVPGDDIRHIDWKVYGKSDRYYIKEFEEETNLKAYVVVDTSNSMSYAGEGQVSKLDYSRYSAASLLYLIQKQRDAGALITFGKGVRTFLPPGTSGSHFRNMMRELSEAKADGETDLGSIFNEIADRLRSRSLVVVFSDLLDRNDEGILRGLHRMGHRGHDVIVFHVLDHDEITFPFDRMTRFEGLEVVDHLLADPKALREAYLAELEQFQTRLKGICLGSRMDYVLLDTSRPLDVALSTYLAQRAGAR